MNILKGENWQNKKAKWEQKILIFCMIENVVFL